jgi:hypothetical protein
MARQSKGSRGMVSRHSAMRAMVFVKEIRNYGCASFVHGWPCKRSGAVDVFKGFLELESCRGQNLYSSYEAKELTTT